MADGLKILVYLGLIIGPLTTGLLFTAVIALQTLASSAMRTAEAQEKMCRILESIQGNIKKMPGSAER